MILTQNMEYFRFMWDQPCRFENKIFLKINMSVKGNNFIWPGFDKHL